MVSPGIPISTANANQTFGFILRNIKTKMPKVPEAA